MNPPMIASPESTLADILARSGRKAKAVPIRKTFLQGGDRSDPEPGPLARLVRRRDDRALQLYLLFHAVATADPWDSTKDARVWARAMNLRTRTGYDTAAISKAWRRLEQQQLVSRSRRGRLARVTLLDESGTGKPYRHHAAAEPYFKLPFEYWLNGWHRRLDLPAKAILLIGLSLPPEFILPEAEAPRWYGISADTTRRGLRELQDRGLLTVQKTVKEAPAAPEGFAIEHRYTLQPPFAKPKRPRLELLNSFRVPARRRAGM
jgi:DNA-binding MarR family transcriptional regulator